MVLAGVELSWTTLIPEALSSNQVFCAGCAAQHASGNVQELPQKSSSTPFLYILFLWMNILTGFLLYILKQHPYTCSLTSLHFVGCTTMYRWLHNLFLIQTAMGGQMSLGEWYMNMACFLCLFSMASTDYKENSPLWKTQDVPKLKNFHDRSPLILNALNFLQPYC